MCWFCSWSLVHATFSSRNSLHVDLSLHETCVLIFLIMKLVLSIELVACWLLVVKLFPCWFSFHKTSTLIFLLEKLILIMGVAVSWLLFVEFIAYWFSLVKFVYFVSSLLVICAFHFLCLDICVFVHWFLLGKFVLFCFFPSQNLYINFFFHKIEFFFGTCCVLICFRGTCCVLMFFRETCCILIFLFMEFC